MRCVDISTGYSTQSSSLVQASQDEVNDKRSGAVLLASRLTPAQRSPDDPPGRAGVARAGAIQKLRGSRH